MDTVRLDGVTFSYGGGTAVDEVSFRIGSGEFVALVGPNGGGKTTVLRLALGLLRPQKGEVWLLGQRQPQVRQWRRVGYVPQRVPALVAGFPATAEEVVAQGLYPGFPSWPWGRRVGHSRVLQALEQADITDLRKRRIGELSVGQQQRVLIARALAHDPEVLFLDEPVAGVDTGTQIRLYRLLGILHRERGVTIIIVSHDIEAVAQQAERVLFLNHTVMFDGTSAEFMAGHLVEAHKGGHADWEPSGAEATEQRR